MNDIEKKMEALKAEFLKKLEELQKEAEAQKEQEEFKPWKPGAGEEYFFVDNNFCARSFCNYDDEVDNYNFEIGNCFRTGERADQVVEKMRLLLRLEQLHDMICPDYVPDYKGDETKYHLYFSHVQGKYEVSCSTSWENPCMAVFDTEKNAQKAAEILNKELTSRRFG
nr:MAG TPA: hypothetical protein [Caudoviricetes sp.]